MPSLHFPFYWLWRGSTTAASCSDLSPQSVRWHHPYRRTWPPPLWSCAPPAAASSAARPPTTCAASATRSTVVSVAQAPLLPPQRPDLSCGPHATRWRRCLSLKGYWLVLVIEWQIRRTNMCFCWDTQVISPHKNTSMSNMCGRYLGP